MKRNFTIDEEIFINQFVQQLHSSEVMEAWFSDRDHAEKREVILNLLNMVVQAHPTDEEIELAARKLGKENSPSAVKLMNKRKPYCTYGYELADLPEKELKTGFLLLLTILSMADSRRRATECKDGCSHWWHKDLSDEATVQGIKQQ